MNAARDIELLDQYLGQNDGTLKHLHGLARRLHPNDTEINKNYNHFTRSVRKRMPKAVQATLATLRRRKGPSMDLHQFTDELEGLCRKGSLGRLRHTKFTVVIDDRDFSAAVAGVMREAILELLHRNDEPIVIGHIGGRTEKECWIDRLDQGWGLPPSKRFVNIALNRAGNRTGSGYGTKQIVEACSAGLAGDAGECLTASPGSYLERVALAIVPVGERNSSYAATLAAGTKWGAPEQAIGDIGYHWLGSLGNVLGKIEPACPYADPDLLQEWAKDRDRKVVLLLNNSVKAAVGYAAIHSGRVNHVICVPKAAAALLQIARSYS